MTENFELEYKDHLHTFEWDKKDGNVWLIENDGMKSNSGQVKPAKSLDQAKEIARQMLHVMGY